MTERNYDKILLITLFLLSFILVQPVWAQSVEPERQPRQRINVYAIVSDNIESLFLQAAGLLKQEEGMDSFPLQGFQIHCTLYMTDYPVEAKDRVINRMAALARSTGRFDIITDGLELTSGNWFFLNFARTWELQALSDAVVRLLSPLRLETGHVPAWAQNYPAKLEYIKQYGSPNVFTEYNPHLTFLSRANRHRIQRFMNRHQSSSFSMPVTGQVVGIGIGPADRNGQILEPWRVFWLR